MDDPSELFLSWENKARPLYLFDQPSDASHSQKAHGLEQGDSLTKVVSNEGWEQGTCYQQDSWLFHSWGASGRRFPVSAVVDSGYLDMGLNRASATS